MKIYLDTANVNEIKEYVELGLCDGVTTNPSILAKEGKDITMAISAIAKIVSGPINVEPIATDFDGIIKEAEEYAKIGKNIVIKLPMIKEGLKAVGVLKKKKIMTSITLVFSPSQALIAAKAGADFVIPFVGRVDDGGAYGTEMVAQIAQIYSNYEIKTKILAASIRVPMHVIELALAGVDIVSVPKSVLETMIKHPYTDAGIKKFLEDWNKKKT
ncbi:MAG: fructose-6-phosphate aldolase [Candidatus Firestonebacteria bacterium RIFOXYA2_FULL_40_8]|nr:MAG: fructose-6-phosphate aldolase [Candidatus Firestonebacteria bacterium RIFOXYA2_FULL_40_8]